MAMATLTSATSLTNNRDVSFSSYLSKTEEVFVQKLAGSNKNQEDGEIGVFSAEKYFKGGIDEDSPRLTNIIPRKYHQPKKDEDPVKPNLVHPPISTPSIHSESSWNSQTALLQNVDQRKTTISPRKSSNKNIKHGIKTTTSSSSKNFSFLAGLCCKYCSCYDKDSIDVDDEHVGEISFKKSPVNGTNLFQVQVQPKPIIKSTSLDDLDHHHQTSLSGSGSQIGIKKENYFSFPTSNSSSVSGKLQIQKEGEVLKPRKSLEVFGSPVHDKRSKSFRIERRLSMLSWDTIPAQKMDEIEYSNISGGGGIHNDNESDASSDLFEIESLTGKVNPFLARQGSDATSGCVTPTTCYAPSEASIEWSVVTASAADFSVISDFEELRPPTRIPSPIKTSKEIIPKRRPNILLGCNSHKSVRVAGDAYSRTSDKTDSDPRIMRRVSDSYMPVTRFPAETKLLMGFDARQRLPALNSHSLPRSQNSHLLYIQ